MDSDYALTSHLATEFHCASEHKVRLRDAANELASGTGTSCSGPKRSTGPSDMVTSGQRGDMGLAQTVNKYEKCSGERARRWNACMSG